MVSFLDLHFVVAVATTSTNLAHCATQAPIGSIPCLCFPFVYAASGPVLSPATGMWRAASSRGACASATLQLVSAAALAALLSLLGVGTGAVPAANSFALATHALLQRLATAVLSPASTAVGIWGVAPAVGSVAAASRGLLLLSCEQAAWVRAVLGMAANAAPCAAAPAGIELSAVGWPLRGIFMQATVALVVVQAAARWQIGGSGSGARRPLAPPDSWLVSSVTSSGSSAIVAAWSATASGAGRLLGLAVPASRAAILDAVRAAVVAAPLLVLGSEAAVGLVRAAAAHAPQLIAATARSTSPAIAAVIGAAVAPAAAAAAAVLPLPLLGSAHAAAAALVDLCLRLAAAATAPAVLAATAVAAALPPLPTLAAAPAPSLTLVLVHWLPTLVTTRRRRHQAAHQRVEPQFL